MSENVFSADEVTHILYVKEKIRDKMTEMLSTNWAQSFSGSKWSHFFLTGGAIASLLQYEEPKDWDIYCDNVTEMLTLDDILKKHESDIQEVVSEYIEVLINKKMVTANATTMKGGYSFIRMMSLSPADTKKTFDYLHCTPHYDIFHNKLYISRSQYSACVNKALVVNNPNQIKDYRKEKFIKRGYKV